jgi:hypothetical protein
MTEKNSYLCQSFLRIKIRYLVFPVISFIYNKKNIPKNKEETEQ